MMTLEEAILRQAATTGHAVTWMDVGILFAVLAVIIGSQYVIMRWREKHASNV